MDFLIPQTQVLIWTVIVFFALLAVLWKFAWGPLLKALEEREQRIAKRIGDAEGKFKEAEERAEEYERRIAAAKDEAVGIIEEGKRDVEKVREEIMASANEEAGRTLARTKREIQLAKEAAVHELRVQMVDLTAELASKLIQREVKPEDHRHFVEETIRQLEQRAAGN